MTDMTRGSREMPRKAGPPGSSLRMVLWGTYDLGKPLNRILLRGLEENGAEVIQCHRDVWAGVEDKSQVRGLGRRLRLIAKWLISYPGLILRYERLPRHDVVFIGYLGTLDVLVLWPFADCGGLRSYKMSSYRFTIQLSSIKR